MGFGVIPVLQGQSVGGEKDEDLHPKVSQVGEECLERQARVRHGCQKTENPPCAEIKLVVIEGKNDVVVIVQGNRKNSGALQR